MALNNSKIKIRNMLIIIALFIVLGILFCFIFTNKKYVAESELLFKTNNIPENFVLSKNNFKTYEEIIKNNNTYSELNNNLNSSISYNDYNRIISVSHNADSNTILVKAKLKRESNAISVVDEVDKIFINRFAEIYEDIDVVILEEPHISGQINDRSVILIITIFGLIGVSFAFVYSCLSNKLKSKIVKKGIEGELNIKHLAEIPINKKDKKIIEPNNKSLKIIKAFDNLRTVIQFLNFDKKVSRKYLITSIYNGEGKSYISANLAISYALSNKKTVLIDANMDSGIQDKLFNVPNNIGLSNYLSSLNDNGIEIDELISRYIKETSIKNLNIITSGTIPPNSVELLAGDQIERLLSELNNYFDIIIIDGTSISNSTNSLILTRFADSTIIVTTSNKTTKEDLQRARKELQNVGGSILGIVSNKVKPKRAKLGKIIIDGIANIKEKIKNYFYKKSIKALPEGTNRIENVIIETEEKVEPVEEVIVEETIIEEIKEDNNDITDVEEKNDSKKIENAQEEKQVVSDKENDKEEKIIDKEKSINFKEKIKSVKEKINEKKEKIDSKNTVDEKIERADSVQKENIENDEKETIVVEEKVAENNSVEDEKETFNNELFEDNNVEESIEKKNVFVNALSFLKTKISNGREIIKEKLKSSKEDVDHKENEQNEDSFESLIKENLENSEELISYNMPSETEELKKYDEYEQISMEQMGNSEESISTNTVSQNNENIQILEQYLNDENTILICIDAKNAYCRIFGRECFIEKPIRTINAGNQNQPFYTKDFIKKYKNRLKNTFSLNEEQIKRVDLLVYTSLREYDDALWTDKRVESFKAEAYVNVMAKEYYKFVGESEQEFMLRVHRDRRIELAKSYIDIEYILDSIWKFNKMKMNDKIILQKYANEIEIQDLLKNDFEKLRSKQNRMFYNNIVNATNEFRVNEVSVNDDTGKLLEKIKKDNRTEMEFNHEDDIEIEKEIIEKQKKFKREKTRIDKIEERKERKAIKEEKKRRAKEAKRKAKQIMKERKELQKEEARIEEELLTNNLYPKTKYYKDL